MVTLQVAAYRWYVSKPNVRRYDLTATPAPTESTTSKIVTASTVVATHHPIIKLLIAATLIWMLAGKAEKLWANHEQKVFDAKSAQLSSQVQQNAQQAAQSAALAQQNAALAEQYKALSAQLESQNATLSANLKKQQSVDATLPPTDLAAHWDDVIKQANAVHPIASGGYQITQEAAVATVQALDALPAAEAEVANDEKLLATQQGLVTGLNNQIGSLNTQIIELQKTNEDEITVCQAEVNKVKANDAVALHKAKKKYFKLGFITGVGVSIATAVAAIVK